MIDLEHKFDRGIRKPIEELFAWISVHPDGSEGVLSWRFGDTHLPLIGADKERIESFRRHAELVRQATGYPIKLVRYSTRTELERL